MHNITFSFAQIFEKGFPHKNWLGSKNKPELVKQKTTIQLIMKGILRIPIKLRTISYEYIMP